MSERPTRAELDTLIDEWCRIMDILPELDGAPEGDRAPILSRLREAEQILIDTDVLIVEEHPEGHYHRLTLAPNELLRLSTRK